MPPRRTRVRVTGMLAATAVFSGGAASAWTAPLPAAAPARSADTSSTQAGESEQRGQQALASLDYPWRELGYSIEFRDYTGGTLGSANSRTKKIVVYVKKSQSSQSLRVTISHELGHALDFEHATNERRREYRTVRKLDQSARWFPCDRCSDYESHAGDWAEVFAVWLAGPGDFRSKVAGPPTSEQLRRLTPLFRLPRAPSPAPSPSASPRPTASPSPSPAGLVPIVPEPTAAPAEQRGQSEPAGPAVPALDGVLRFPGPAVGWGAGRLPTPLPVPGG